MGRLANPKAKRTAECKSVTPRAPARAWQAGHFNRSSNPRGTGGQVACQRRVQLLVSAEGYVINIDHLTAFFQLTDESSHLSLIRPPQGVRLGQHLGQA